MLYVAIFFDKTHHNVIQCGLLTTGCLKSWKFTRKREKEAAAAAEAHDMTHF